MAGLLDGVAVARVGELIVKTSSEIEAMKHSISFPVVMKVIGPVHKTDVGGVLLNIKSLEEMQAGFEQLMEIDQAKGVLIQPMITGTELFIGVKRESNFGHIILCGLGGIYVETLKDISVKMIPISKQESLDMITNLKSYPILRGVRGQKGIDLEEFAKIIRKIAGLLQIAPEISELDINPLMANEGEIIAVDCRIKIEK